MLAIFIERSGPDTLHLATGKRRLEHVAGIERASGIARPNDGMQLVDEEDDLPFAALHFFHTRLETLFKFAAETGPGQHGPHVERNHPFAHQRLRHIVADDLLRQPFDNRRLAHARFTDQDWIIFSAATEHLHHAQHFGIAADDRVKRPFAGGVG